MATAAYEQEDDAAPSPVASATGRTPLPPSVRSMRERGVHACTIALMRKPSTSAHQTSQAIRNASSSPSASVSSTLTCSAPGALRAHLLVHAAVGGHRHRL